MLSPSIGVRDGPSPCPTGSLELAVRPRRRLRRWPRHTVGALLALLVLALVLPPALGLSHHTVSDDAMSGTMGRGSAVFTKPLPLADLEIGDVITYSHPSKSGVLVTRRIAAIEAGVLQTYGDRTGALDPWVLSLDQPTQARAVAHVPYAGYAYDALASGAGLLRSAASWLH